MKKNKYILISSLFVVLGIAIGAFSVLAIINASNDSDTILTNRTDLASCNFNISREDLEESLGQDNPNIDSALAYVKFREIRSAFVPSGVPEVYGQELDISFDQVQDAINKVAIFDPTYGKQKIELSDNDLQRYIDINLSISCEYCCGAETLVFENGDAACGCEHSQMMRGLAAYLIKNHQQMSNQDILDELVSWKRTYFPKQTLSVELKKLEESGEEGIKEILEEFPDFLPQMVGGC